jgi:alpha-N-arabinofuranosidase
MFIGTALASTALAAQPTFRATLDVKKAGPEISPDIFGQFAEMLGEGIYGGVWVGPNSNIPNVRGIRSDVVNALKALHVPNVRWPGGCYADNYHWRDGIGPNSARRARVNTNWGGSLEPNTFGTHEFMDFVEQIGSEAYITLNVGSGTVAEASDWLEYMTTDKPTSLGKERRANGRASPWRIKYLGIGNESWGCGGSMGANAYVERMKNFAVLAQNINPAQASNPLAENPNDSKRIAVSQGLGETEYTSALMKAWKSRSFPRFWQMDGIALHYYSWLGRTPMADSSTEFGVDEYAGLLKRAYLMDDMIVQHSKIMDEYDPEKKVAIVVDEWGAWLKPEPGRNPAFLRQQNTLRDAILASITLNTFARHADRVRMSNIAQMVNVIQSMILTEGPKMVLTPTYHVYSMYVPFQGATLVPLDAGTGFYGENHSGLPSLDVLSAKAKDGTVWVALTNLNPSSEAELLINIKGMAVKSGAGQQLTGLKVNSFNTFDGPRNVAPRDVRFEADGDTLPIRVPAKSVTVVRLVD